jgi:hypothetical protein
MQPPSPQYPEYPGTTLPIATPPKKSRKRLLLSIGIPVVTFVAGIGIGAAAGGSSADANLAAPAPEVTITQAAPGPTVTVTSAAPAAVAKPTPTPKPKPVKASIADGETVVVGDDVPAGKYDAHSTDASNCYWEIDKSGTNGQDIVANGGASGHLVVTLKRGEDFTSDSCGDWTQE